MAIVPDDPYAYLPHTYAHLYCKQGVKEALCLLIKEHQKTAFFVLTLFSLGVALTIVGSVCGDQAVDQLKTYWRAYTLGALGYLLLLGGSVAYLGNRIKFADKAIIIHSSNLRWKQLIDGLWQYMKTPAYKSWNRCGLITYEIVDSTAPGERRTPLSQNECIITVNGEPGVAITVQGSDLQYSFPVSIEHLRDSAEFHTFIEQLANSF